MRTDQAKAIPMDALLTAMGHQPERERRGELWYQSPFRPNETEASFVVTADRRAWYDHGRGEGGNILDFMMAYAGVDLKGALRELDTLMGEALLVASLPPLRPQKQKTSNSAVVVQQVCELHSKALKQYLNLRGIPLSVGQQWLKEIHFTLDRSHFEGKTFYALGFPNQSGDWELRNRYYQGCTGKDLTVIPADEAGTEMAVFEGFMDFLSATVYADRSPSMPCIVLNSASMKQRALEEMIRHKPETVHLYLDNDRTGRELVAYFQEGLGREGIAVADRSVLYQDYKDFNELLMASKRTQSR